MDASTDLGAGGSDPGADTSGLCAIAAGPRVPSNFWRTLEVVEVRLVAHTGECEAVAQMADSEAKRLRKWSLVDADNPSVAFDIKNEAVLGERSGAWKEKKWPLVCEEAASAA